MPGISSQKSESAMNKPKVNWRVAFTVSVACYLPAFLLVLTSGLVSYFLFQNSRTFPQDTNNISSTNSPLTEQQVEEKIKKVLAQQAAIRTVKENSPLAEKYIDGQIKQEARDQAEKAAQDEIDKLKADWKGDLYGQISFPIIFSIASIFAAFAVKDVLTEILKEQERNEIKQELKRELRDQIVPEAIEYNQEKINDRIEIIEAYTYWLEHELLGIALAQLIDESKKKANISSEEIEAIEKLLDRANTILNRISSEFRQADFKLLREAEYVALKSRIKNIGLTESSQSDLLDKLSKKPQVDSEKKDGFQLLLENPYEHIDNIVEVQMRLLIITLSKALKNETDDDQLERQNTVARLSKYLSGGSRSSSKERLSIYYKNDPLPP